MTDTDAWFLLIQYRRDGRTEVQKFSELPPAAAAYSDAESQFKDKLTGADPEMDVLLVGASSIDVVRQRYPSYFTTARTRPDKIRKLLAALPAIPAH